MLGRTEREDIEREFKRVARTSPERAAATIQRGIETGRKRILIGADAYALAALSRVAPIRYMSTIKFFEPIVRR